MSFHEIRDATIVKCWCRATGALGGRLATCGQEFSSNDRFPNAVGAEMASSVFICIFFVYETGSCDRAGRGGR